MIDESQKTIFVTYPPKRRATTGERPRKARSQRGMHKGWHFTLNRDSMSFDSMNRKGLREYRRNDSRITLEVLHGERKGQRGGRHFKGMDSVWLDIKISWNVNDDSSVGMSPYEALYEKRCRSPLYQNEVAEC
ncbi:hypothetical protein AgCh_000940 [Apium graveolens]